MRCTTRTISGTDYLLPVFSNTLMNQWRFLLFLITPITSWSVDKLFLFGRNIVIGLRQDSFIRVVTLVPYGEKNINRNLDTICVLNTGDDAKKGVGRTELSKTLVETLQVSCPSQFSY